MASSGKGDAKANKPAESAANAVDGLTPPTMKYDNASTGGASVDSERTQIGPAPSSANVAKPPSSPSGSGAGNRPSSPTITGDMAAGTGISPSFSTSIGAQDLSGERLLRDAPRVESNGKTYPALNQIPLIAKIGQGGMGAVYYGVHPRLHSEVAVKVLPFHLAEQDPAMVKRFYREAQIAAMVRSPHLVNVMDVNEESGLFFLVMEFVPGKTAGQYLKITLENGMPGIPELEALDISIAATIGLQAAHANQIVHRDLKPENIMVPYLSRNSNKEFDLKRSKLMDLGLARNEESSQSLTGVQAAMGTPGYMAPEQALDAKTADKRSDIFGMGATIYALLTGKPPFRGEAIMKVLMATMHEPHEPVVKVRPDVSQHFSDVVDKCLDKKQDNRFQDATQLLKALRACRRQLAPANDEMDEGDEPAEQGAIPGMSVARQPAAGVKTIVSVGQGYDKTMVGDGVQPARSKTGLYVAIAAAGLILAGGIGYAVMSKGGDPGKVVEGTGTSTGTNSDPGKKIKLPTPDDLAAAKESHGMFLDRAKVKLLNDDAGGAELMLEKARKEYQDFPKQEKTLEPFFTDLKKAEDDIASSIATAKKGQEFKKKIKDVDDALAVKDYDKASLLAKEARTLAQSTNDKNTAEEKRRSVDDLIAKRDDIKRFNTLFSQAQDSEKKGSVEDALDKANQALVISPDSDDVIKFAKKCQDAIDLKRRKAEYDSLMKQVADAKANGRPEAALQLATDASRKRPDLPEAKEAIAQLLLVVDKASAQDEQRKHEAERQRKVADAAALGNTLALAGKFEEAQGKLKELLDLNADNDKAVLELKKIVDDGLEKKRKLAEQLRTQKKFDEKATAIAGALASEDGNWDALQPDIDGLKTIIPDSPRIAELNTQLQNRLKYKKALTAASAAFEKGELKVADDNIKEALALFKDGERAKTFVGILNKKNDDAKKEAFAGFIRDSEAAEKTGKLDDALKAVSDARALIPEDKKALDRESGLKARIQAIKATLENYNAKMQDAEKQVKDAPEQSVATLDALRPSLQKEGLIFNKELASLEIKYTDYKKAAEAKWGQIVAAAIQQAKTFVSNKDLNGALDILKKMPAAAQARSEIKDAQTAIAYIQQAQTEIGSLKLKFDDRLITSTRRFTQNPNKPAGEKATCAAAIAKLAALPDLAITQLAQADLKDNGVTATLKQNKDLYKNQVEASLDRLAEIRDDPPPAPPPPPQRPSPPPAQKSHGTIGEGNVDD